MKTVFTLLLATFFSASAFAYEGGRLTITVAAKRNISVYVDNRMYQSGDNAIVLNNLQPGSHSIQVYRNTGRNTGNGGWGRGNSRNSRGELLYSSNVYIRSSYHTDVVVNRFGKALVDERLINDRNGGYSEGDWDDEGYGDGYNNGNGGYNGSRAMSESEFNQLTQRIRNSWFGRLGVARDALTSSYFRTEQVRQILQLFTAESDKLELAKAGYRNTVDRQNYRTLYDQLSWNSQSELDRYIRENRW
jgi:hypothetical protein